jgi:hypothetical protein
MSLRGRYVGVGALMLVGAAVLLAATANAAPTIEAGGGAVTTQGQSGNHLYTATLTADVSPSGIGLVAVTWNCQAEASPAAISTSIGECSVGGVNAPPTTLPGTAVATATTFVFPAGVTLTACVSGFASFPEVLLGGQLVNGPRTCKQLSTVAL